MVHTFIPLRVHWIRHGRVASHRGDIPVTDEGLHELETAGQQLSRQLAHGEVVSLLHAPTRRTRETALVLYETLMREWMQKQGQSIRVLPPQESFAIRNPDLYVAGQRVEMVSSATALLEQIPDLGLTEAAVERMPFLQGFWSTPDRIGYWVSHPQPPGEDADTVAYRLLTFAVSLLDLPRSEPCRYLCVTHSGPMRAFLRRYLLHYDPGEPEYGESIVLDICEDVVHVRYREQQNNISPYLYKQYPQKD